MNLQLLYFAQLREKFGRAHETLEAPASVHTVADLIAHLARTPDGARRVSFGRLGVDARDRLRAHPLLPDEVAAP